MAKTVYGKVKPSLFTKKWNNDHLLNFFKRATRDFREIHNNYYKPEFDQEEYDEWNTFILEDWTFRPTLKDSAKNKQFDVYRFDLLEASGRNPDKTRYSRTHLQHDLCHFFRYLPLSEVRRMTYVFTWLLKEALKNYGCLCIPGFGTFFMYDKPVREVRQAFCSKKWAARRHRLARSIEFFPSQHLYNICVPRTVKFMGFEGKYNKSQFIPSMFDSFVDEKIHRRRGRLFFQDVFDKQWTWLGYSEEYTKEQINLYLFDNETNFDDLDR